MSPLINLSIKNLFIHHISISHLQSIKQRFLYFYHIKNLSRSDFNSLMQKPFDIQLISLIILASLLIKWMLRDIIFAQQKWTYTSNLQDALITIHDCNFIHGHEILATLLIAHEARWIVASAFTGVIHVDGFFSKELG